MPERRYAYVILPMKDGYVIGRAIEGIRGASPVLKEGKFEDYQEARLKAGELNAGLGLSDEDAEQIVSTTQ